MATKAEIEAKRARDLALKQLDKSQEAKIIALREALRVQNVPSSEIASIIKQEEAANQAEVTALRSTMAAGGEPNIVSKLSTPVPGNTAALVDDTLKQATALYDKLGFQEISNVKADGSYDGVPMSDMVKVVLNTDPATGKLTKGSDKTLLSDQSFKLYNSAFENIGKPRTAEEVGATTPLGTDANGNQLFTKKIAVNTQRRGYEILKQNPDGTLSAIGYTASTLPPQDDGNFWTSDLGKAVMIGASLAGGWALAPVSAGGLGFGATIGSALGTSAAVGTAVGGGLLGATTAAATGGDILTGAVLGAVGGYGAGGGFASAGDYLKATFADITGIPVADLNASFAAQDALTMAQNGLSNSAIQQNLIASGVDSLTAASLADAAILPGATVSSLTTSIGASPTYTNVAGMLSGGDAFATTQEVFNKLVSEGMTAQQAVDTINTSGGGLGLGTVGLDGAGNLVQQTTGTKGNLLTGDAATAATTTTAADAIKDKTDGLITKDTASGLLKTAAGVALSAEDRAALREYAGKIESAGAKAAPQMQFKPVGMTTRFGSTTTPQYDANGRLIGFGYTAAPDIAAQRDRLLSLSNEALPTTTNVEQATADYLRGLEALQRPADEQNLANLTSRLQATGRGGLGFGATTGAGGSTALAATNPELAAYYNALAQRQAQQALTAQDVAQQRLTRQLDLNKGLFGQAQTLETAAQQPLVLGTDIGRLSTTGSTNAAKTQYGAAVDAAKIYADSVTGFNANIGTIAAGSDKLFDVAGNAVKKAVDYIF